MATIGRGKTIIHALLELIEGQGGVAINRYTLAKTLNDTGLYGEVDDAQVSRAMERWFRRTDPAAQSVEKVGDGLWRFIVPGQGPAGDDVEFDPNERRRAPSPSKKRSTAVRGAYIVGLVQALFVEIEDYVAQVEGDTADLRTKAAAYDRIARQFEKGV